MKCVFITLPEILIARNLFDTDFWPRLKDALSGWRIVILVHENRRELYRERFKEENIEVVGLAPTERGRLVRFLNALALNAIDTSTNRWEKMRAYGDGRSSLMATVLKRLHTRLLGRSDAYKRWLRRRLLSALPGSALTAIFETYAPAAVVLTSLTNYDFDVLIGKEARRRGIPLIGMPRSWDNFTSHGLIRVMPDQLLVQNAYLKNAAHEHQAVEPRETAVQVFGVPHYDVYKTAGARVIAKEVLFERLGLDPAKKLVLYGAMGDYLFPHEGRVISALERALSNIGGAQAIFRAHPHFASPLDSIDGLEYVRPDRFALRVDRARSDQQLDSLQSEHLLSSLYWSDVIVTSASTFAIDGVAMGKPVICIAYDMGADVRYWYSNERFYDQYAHFEALVATGAVTVVRSDEELTRALKEHLGGAVTDVRARQRMLDLFVEPFDGSAGERLAAAVAGAIQPLAVPS